MSDLQKSFLKAKLSQLPPDPPMPPGHELDEDEDETDQLSGLPSEQDDDSSSASSASSAGTIKPRPTRNLFARPQGTSGRNSALEQLPWTDFFAEEVYLETSNDSEKVTHHAYLTPPSKSGPLFVTHHGAGSSGLSFAVLASEIRKLLPEAGILSLDARGHGSTVVESISSNTTSGDNPSPDLHLEILSQDLLDVVLLTKEKMQWTELPPILLVGHSLGGAVVTDVAKQGKLGDKVLGYAVLDVVEGSAIDALKSMHTYLSTRPSGFATLAAGIQWHARSRTIRDPISARVSVPALLRQDLSASSPNRAWIWRTDLAATQPFWEGWFVGLSKKFLEARGGKLLLLAGTDRLDTELTIGQMQGKYQLQVFPDAGHFIQEDLPARTAQILVDFYHRNDRSALVLPPKVGDLLKKQGKV